MKSKEEVIEIMAEAIRGVPVRLCDRYVAMSDNQLRENSIDLANAALEALCRALPTIEVYREYIRSLPQKINPPSNDVGEILYNQLIEYGKED